MPRLEVWESPDHEGLAVEVTAGAVRNYQKGYAEMIGRELERLIRRNLIGRGNYLVTIGSMRQGTGHTQGRIQWTGTRPPTTLEFWAHLPGRNNETCRVGKVMFPADTDLDKVIAALKEEDTMGGAVVDLGTGGQNRLPVAALAAMGNRSPYYHGGSGKESVSVPSKMDRHHDFDAHGDDAGLVVLTVHEIFGETIPGPEMAPSLASYFGYDTSVLTVEQKSGLLKSLIRRVATPMVNAGWLDPVRDSKGVRTQSYNLSQKALELVREEMAKASKETPPPSQDASAGPQVVSSIPTYEDLVGIISAVREAKAASEQADREAKESWARLEAHKKQIGALLAEFDIMRQRLENERSAAQEASRVAEEKKAAAAQKRRELDKMSADIARLQTLKEALGKIEL